MSKHKTFAERIEMRKKYLDKVWDAIVKHMENEGYFEMGSCNKDYSRYLVLRGTEDQVSYHGKPDKSLRISDHWHWVNDRKAPGEIQCELAKGPTASKWPVKVSRIAVFINGKYRFLCGERWENGKCIFDVPDMTKILNRLEWLLSESKKEA